MYMVDVYIQRKVSMVRTQIYLNEDQKEALERLSAERHVSMAELIRTAIDQLIDEDRMQGHRLESALKKSFGLWKDRSDEEIEASCGPRASWAERSARYDVRS